MTFQQLLNTNDFRLFCVKTGKSICSHQTQLKRLAKKKIPDHFDYEGLSHLRKEAKEKLGRFRPTSLDQAQRISGITPADIAMVMLHLEGKSGA